MSKSDCQDYKKKKNGFKRGAKAQVPKDQEFNRLRFSPAIRKDNVIGRIYPEEEMQILAGKTKCADDIVWRLVGTNKAVSDSDKDPQPLGDLVVGWTAEWQKGQGYYLEQVPRLD